MSNESMSQQVGSAVFHTVSRKCRLQTGYKMQTEFKMQGFVGKRFLPFFSSPSLFFYSLHLRPTILCSRNYLLPNPTETLATQVAVTEISVFTTEVSVTGMRIFPYENSNPGNWGRNLSDKIASLSQLSGQTVTILVLYVFPL